MNRWKYIAIIVAGIGMSACQSQTEQTSADTSTADVSQHMETQSTVSVPPAIQAAGKMPTTAEHATGSVAPVPNSTIKQVASVPEPGTVSVQRKGKAPKHAAIKVASVGVDMKALSKCKMCHHFTPKNKVGPGLGRGMLNGHMEPGDFGRTAGTHPGFHYTFVKYIPAGGSWVWDERHIRQWICDSKRAIKAFTGDKTAKTKMPPQHICDPAAQDAVIAALRSIS